MVKLLLHQDKPYHFDSTRRLVCMQPTSVFRSDLEKLEVKWQEIDVPHAGIAIVVPIPQNLDQLPYKKIASQIAEKVEKRFADFHNWSAENKCIWLLALVVIDFTAFQLLLPDSRFCIFIVMLLWAGLAAQCFLISNWVLTTLFGANGLLGLVFLFRPSWALRFSCDSGYITFTS